MDMRADGDCLGAEQVALLVEGGATEPERTRWAAHLEACAACRGLWAASAAGEPLPFPAPAAPDAALLAAAALAQRPRRVRAGRRGMGFSITAAAALLAVALGIRLFHGTDRTGRPFTLPPGRPIAGNGERVATAAGVFDSVHLPDGSRLRLSPSGEMRFRAPGPGERAVVELVRGTLSAEVVKSGGAFRIVSGAGEIRVVGTSFTAKAFKISHVSRVTGHEPEDRKAAPSPPGGEGRGGGAIAVLSVEVTEGAVDLAAGDKTLRVPAGKRGIARAGLPPLLQELMPRRYDAAARELGSDWNDPKFPASVECATLLAGGWGGIGSWEDLLGSSAASRGDRELAAFLTGLSAGPEDAARLLEAARRHPEIREVLRPHLVRIAGEEAVKALDGGIR